MVRLWFLDFYICTIICRDLFADLILLRNIFVDFSSFGNRLAPELGLFRNYDLVKGLYFGNSVKKLRHQHTVLWAALRSLTLAILFDSVRKKLASEL